MVASMGYRRSYFLFDFWSDHYGIEFSLTHCRHFFGDCWADFWGWFLGMNSAKTTGGSWRRIQIGPCWVGSCCQISCVSKNFEVHRCSIFDLTWDDNPSWLWCGTRGINSQLRCCYNLALFIQHSSSVPVRGSYMRYRQVLRPPRGLERGRLAKGDFLISKVPGSI